MPSTSMTDIALPLSQLGAVGDQQTLALIADNGDLVHLSWPRLDDPTLFAPLLNGDGENFCGVRFQPEPHSVSHAHEKGTNILVTTFKFDEGEVVMTDFMPPVADLPKGASGTIIRHVESRVSGPMMMFHARPAGDYEAPDTPLHELSPIAVGCSMTNRPVFVVEAGFGLRIEDGAVRGEVQLQAGESHTVFLGARLEGVFSTADALERTRSFWRDEIADLECDGEFSGTMERSMLSLALLHMRRHGTIAAAGTFGYPEAIGGKRNWDYRYAWVRDSALVAQVAARAGMVEQSLAWVRSVLIGNDGCDRSPLNLMMALDGSQVDEEKVLESWPGYLNSPPVQTGNEASGQLQLDIFGELSMALLTLSREGADIPADMLDRITELTDWLVDNWQRPDSSIWELRGSEKHYLFSRLMSWVAFRDGADLLNRCGRAVPDGWATAQRAVADDIETRFWSDETQCYMQADCTTNADAAIIFMRVVGYLEKGNERWEACKPHLRAELVKHEGVLRFPHHADDGFEKDEGTFVLCTSWWIEALCMDGEHGEARERYDRLLARVGTTGILAEEIGEDGAQLGNLPQAFSHAGLISAALRLRG